MENGLQNSSTTKGESIKDTIRVVSGYGDIIVIRHPDEGAVEEASCVSKVPIINAGDGINHHPTQALTDLYTIYREKGQIDGNNILVYGDITHARTVNSLITLLKNYDVNVVTKDIREPIPMDDVQNADVIYMTRPQKPGNPEEIYYGLQEKMRTWIKKDAIIMHPLPRTKELPDVFLDDPRAVFFRQTQYGLSIRMVLLHILIQCVVT
jgi:aspartate carbamoyltransferase catalytic subunit